MMEGTNTGNYMRFCQQPHIDSHSAQIITDSDDLYQIAILIDQLKHDDVQQRTSASKNISKIGK